jgi:thymidine kinase
MAYLKVITGPMFSGKTEELIRLLRRADLAGKKIVVVKPRLDHRTAEEIASRRSNGSESRDFATSGTYPARPIEGPQELADLIEQERPNILGIDEAQFFKPWLHDYLMGLIRHHKDSDLLILVAGLDMDAWVRPFGIMPQLMALADEVQKETAICFRCKGPAMLTQKLVASNQQVEVGDSEIYEARCRNCHTLPGVV